MTYIKIFSLTVIMFLCSNSAIEAQEDVRVKQLSAIGAENAPLALDTSYIASGSVKMPVGLQVPAQRAVTLLIPCDGENLLVEFRANSGPGTLTGHIIGSIGDVNGGTIIPVEGYLCSEGRLPVINGEWISNIQKALTQAQATVLNADLIAPQVHVDAGIMLTVFLKSNN